MNDVELIKSKIDIVELISEYLQLKKGGRNFKALCPFHSEKTPSFTVSAERQTWHCFGACNEGGDVVSFLQKWENIEFVEALKILAKRAGVTLSNFTPTESFREKEKLYEINHLASEFYHYLLVSHRLGKKAKEYVLQRQIKEKTIETFMLGYAPNSWDSLFKFLTKKGYSSSDIFTAGLLIRSEGGRLYDRFRGRLMFPLKDQRGNVIGFSGRLLKEEVEPGRERGAKYVNTPETPVYVKGNTLFGLNMTKEAIKREKKAVIVEGEFDFLASFQSGVGNVVAIKGSALTEGQVLLLKRYTDEVILALDSDFAGNEAARRGIEIAENAGLTVRVVELAFGKDPAECVEKSPHLWKDSIEKAIPVYNFIVNLALKKYDKKDVFGKKKIAQEVLPVIAKISNLIVQSHYIKEIARELEVTDESIVSSIKNLIKKKESGQIPSVEKQNPHQRHLLLEEYLLSLILQSEDPKGSLEEVLTILEFADFSQVPVVKIIEELVIYFKTHEKLDVKIFGKSLTAEIVSTFDKAYLVDINATLSNQVVFRKELLTSSGYLKTISLRRRINLLSTKIRQAEEENKEEEVIKLQEESRLRLSQLKEVEKIGQKAIQ